MWALKSMHKSQAAAEFEEDGLHDHVDALAKSSLHGNLGGINNVQLCLQEYVLTTHTHRTRTQSHKYNIHQISDSDYICKCILYIGVSKELASVARLFLCQIPAHFGWQLLLQVTYIPRAIDDAHRVLFQVTCHVLRQTCS